MDKKTKLTVRIAKLIITVLVITITIILIGTMIASFYQTSKVYNDKTMQIAQHISGMLEGDDISYLLSCVDSDEYRTVRDQAEAADDEQLIVDYMTQKYGTDAAARMAERYNKMLMQFRDNWDVEFLYVSVIQGEDSIDLLDSDTGLFALGYKSPLMDKFRSLNGNERVDPTVTRSDYGWLSSGGMPILDGSGNAVAIAFCDISMNQVVKDTLLFVGIILAVCTAIILVARLLINRMVRKTITAPIEELTAAADRFAANEKGVYTYDDVADLNIHTGDEIEELYNATRFMQTSLIDYMNNLTRVTAERERISAELNVATQIQADLLPQIFPAFSGIKEFEISASMDPAKEVGGDFYDFFMVDDDHIALVIADVSGKGVPAALFMVIAKTLLKNRTLMGARPSEIFKNVNSQLCEGNEAELFVTAWLCIVEISTGCCLVANAGHEHPALRRKGGKFELVQYRHSPALAVMDGMTFRQHEFKLEPGDTVFVYTDGVPEAQNASNELFGADRLLEALNSEPEADVDTLISNTTKSINRFVEDAPQFDDITMLAFYYKGGSEQP